MNKCIFGCYCQTDECTEACPKWSETQYLQLRNKINEGDYNYTYKDLDRMLSIIDKASEQGFVTLERCKLHYISEIGTVCIDNLYHNNGHRCSVYTISFNDYISKVKDNFSRKSKTEEFEMMEIWMKSAKVLLIYGLDYMPIGTFEFSTLFQIFESREFEGKSTIVTFKGKIEDLNINNEIRQSVVSALKGGLYGEK